MSEYYESSVSRIVLLLAGLKKNVLGSYFLPTMTIGLNDAHHSRYCGRQRKQRPKCTNNPLPIEETRRLGRRGVRYSVFNEECELIWLHR